MNKHSKSKTGLLSEPKGHGLVNRRLKLLLTCGVSSFFWAAPALAQQVDAGFRLAEATLVPPTTAWANYGNPTEHTVSVVQENPNQRSLEIRTLAANLDAGGALSQEQFIDAAFQYVYRNIKPEFRFGLGKGARGAISDQSGTSFDQAHLLVEILREKGISAEYRVGTVTLTASQFGKWTGLVHTLNEAAQTFSVDAIRACELLADGGIPATVNGASSCTGLTGALSSVVMGHVWVVANGKFYDPSFKPHVLLKGIDIPASANCGSQSVPTCGSTIASSLTTGSTLGTLGGVTSRSSLNRSSVETQLASYASNIQSAITTQGLAGKGNVHVTGGKEIDDSQIPSGLTSLGYVSQTQYTWTGNIPNKFRTLFGITVGPMAFQFYGDEAAGRQVKLFFDNGPGLEVDTSGQYTYLKLSLDSYVAASQKLDPHPLTIGISVDHPYPTASYADTSYNLTVPLNLVPIQFGLALGHTGPDVVRQVARAAIKPLRVSFDPPSNTACTSFIVSAGCIENGATLVPAFLSQQSAYLTALSDVSKSTITQHHSIGLLGDSMGSGGSSGGSGGGIELNRTSILHFGALQSIRTASAASSDRAAILTAAGALSSMLEGGVLQQGQGSWPPHSGVPLLVVANERGDQLLDVGPGQVSGLLPSLIDYDQYRKDRLTVLGQQGYTNIISRRGYIRDIPVLGNSSLMTILGSGDFATKSGSVLALINETYKGGGNGMGQDPVKGVLSSLERKEKERLQVAPFKVDHRTGQLSGDTIVDLADGAGQSPLAMQLSRNFTRVPAARNCVSTIDVQGAVSVSCESNINPVLTSEIMLGWKHNYQVKGKFSHNGMAPFENGTALGIVETVAGLYSMLDSARSSTFERRLSTIFSAYWLSQRSMENVVELDLGGAQKQFVRNADGIYRSNKADERLAVTRTPAAIATTCVSNPTVGSTQFSYTTADGSNLLLSGAAQRGCRWRPYEPTYSVMGQEWVNPIGVKTKFDYLNTFPGQPPAGASFPTFLSAARNSVGKRLDFLTTIDNDTGELLLDRVNANSGNFVKFSRQLSNSVVAVEYANTATIKYNDMTIEEILSWGGGLPTNSADTRDTGTFLRKITDPSGLPVWIDYDNFGKVTRIRDQTNKATHYYSSGFSNERAPLFATKDRLGNVTRFVAAERVGDREIIDPLGRKTRNIYDSLGYLLRTIYPEGNAVEYSYDLRGNRTRECMIRKGVVTWTSLTALTERNPQCNTARTPIPDLATVTTYVEGPTLRADQCVNPKTCNKVSSVTDPKAGVTNYEWSAVHGQLTKETKPADASGVRPVTDYEYSPFTGVDGATFYLLTAKVESIAGTTTAITSTSRTEYQYDAANKFVLKSMVLDPAGLNLRSCFKFDAAGNLISKTDPKAGLAVCP